jgi:hypothetical protein
VAIQPERIQQLGVAGNKWYVSILVVFARIEVLTANTEIREALANKVRHQAVAVKEGLFRSGERENGKPRVV